LFTLRAGLYELDKLVKNGMSQADFDATRRFLTKNVNALTKTQDAQLGYAIDGRYYGIPTFTDYVRDQLAKLKLEDVNRAIKKHLQAENVKIAVVTRDAEAFKQEAIEGKPSPISYTSMPPKEILEEDKVIEAYKLNFNPKKVEVIPVAQVFQK
jgi:zinc protease